jgi:hypothetical protein
MKPANPRDPDPDRSPPLAATDIHSGTATKGGPAASTARDDHSRENPAGPVMRNPVRNPVPLPDDAARRTSPQPTLPTQDDSPNGTGVWQHDETGPAAYVPPLVKVGDTHDRPDLPHLTEALSLQLGTLPDWGAQSIQIRRIDARLHLFGTVTSEVIRRAAHRCVAQESGEPVDNRLVVR